MEQIKRKVLSYTEKGENEEGLQVEMNRRQSVSPLFPTDILRTRLREEIGTFQPFARKLSVTAGGDQTSNRGRCQT